MRRAVLLLTLLMLPGCYNSEQLIERARNSAMQTRLEEIDLGTYRTTLPFDETTGSRTEIVLRLIGTAVRYRLEDIQQHIEQREFLLRQATITAIRQTLPAELADPELADLRDRLFEVTNEVLVEEPIDSLAIAELMIIPQ